MSVAAEPSWPPPVTRCTPIPRIPPMKATTVPEVGATELAMTSLSELITCGSAADSDDRKNRLTPSTRRAPMYSGSPNVPVATKPAATATKANRVSADQTRICRRDQRSMNTPANGPTSEYGRYRTAKATAAAPGSGKLWALKNT
jgi:hypothetical protein